jgi:hypothetical protein
MTNEWSAAVLAAAVGWYDMQTQSHMTVAHSSMVNIIRITLLCRGVITGPLPLHLVLCCSMPFLVYVNVQCAAGTQ